jgi:hypothetical protein
VQCGELLDECGCERRGRESQEGEADNLEAAAARELLAHRRAAEQQPQQPQQRTGATKLRLEM